MNLGGVIMIKNKVLIAGVAGASLGTEIFKSLRLSNNYIVYGCDISEFAYGLYEQEFEKTFLVDENNYVKSIINICRENNIKYVVPGAEKTMILLANEAMQLLNQGVYLIINSKEIIETFSDKANTFIKLSELGFNVPITKSIKNEKQLQDMIYPCVIKPSTGSGGSSFVFLVANIEEAKIYTKYLIKNGKDVIAQEYIPEDEGEFTVGVLNLPNGNLVGSIALKRVFSSKLSVASKLKAGLISSGNSQGLIDEFKDIRTTCEKIAVAIGSKGPINIQGRVKSGNFIPFEINPRFSASNYLRSLAGFNELDIFLKFIINGEVVVPSETRYGYYFRSFTENFISKEDIKSDQMD